MSKLICIQQLTVRFIHFLKRRTGQNQQLKVRSEMRFYSLLWVFKRMRAFFFWGKNPSSYNRWLAELVCNAKVREFKTATDDPASSLKEVLVSPSLTEETRT